MMGKSAKYSCEMTISKDYLYQIFVTLLLLLLLLHCLVVLISGQMKYFVKKNPVFTH